MTEEKVNYGSYADYLQATFKGQSDADLEDGRRVLLRAKHTGRVPNVEAAERTIKQIEDEQERRKREGV